MKTQLKVIKADGTAEEYLHTKVVGTINNALAQADQPDIRLAEELTEVVTYFLYRQNRRSVTTGEVFSVIKAALAATGHHEAAAALSEHYFERKLKRSRTEVAHIDIQDLADAHRLCRSDRSTPISAWDKAAIVDDLVTKHRFPRQTARAVASMVEERVFNMGMTLVPASLVKQLVLRDAASLLQAQQQLQTV